MSFHDKNYRFKIIIVTTFVLIELSIFHITKQIDFKFTRLIM
jgi:hypothetical protein